MLGLKRGGTSGRSIESQIEVMQSYILDVIFAEGCMDRRFPAEEMKEPVSRWSPSNCTQAQEAEKSKHAMESVAKMTVRGEVLGPILWWRMKARVWTDTFNESQRSILGRTVLSFHEGWLYVRGVKLSLIVIMNVHVRHFGALKTDSLEDQPPHFNSDNFIA